MIRTILVGIAVLSTVATQAATITTNVVGQVPFNDADNALGFGTGGIVSVDLTFSFDDSASEVIGAGNPNESSFDALTTATAVIGGVHIIEYNFGPDPVSDIFYFLNPGGDQILILTFEGEAYSATFTGGPLTGQSLDDGSFAVHFNGPAGTLTSDQLNPIPTTGWTSGLITIAGKVAGQSSISVCCNTVFTQISSIFNLPPISDAGVDQAIRAGDTVFLNGSASYDDNTASAALDYDWTFSSKPGGSSAVLANPGTAMPSFVADLAGTYVIELVVTDEGSLASDPDQVQISSDNLAPTAVAGDDELVVIGTTVSLDGSGSTDPETDALNYAWSFTSKPEGSAAFLINPDSATPSFDADSAGTYLVDLVVSDFLGPGAPDTVEIMAASAGDFSQLQIVSSSTVIEALGAGQVTTSGNQNALLNSLSQAVSAIQKGKISQAIDKLEQALSRTDGCVLRGSPDGNGPSRDWITDCTAQIETYGDLNAALDALTP